MKNLMLCILIGGLFLFCEHTDPIVPQTAILIKGSGVITLVRYGVNFWGSESLTTVKIIGTDEIITFRELLGERGDTIAMFYGPNCIGNKCWQHY